MWLEIKLLLLIPFLWMCALAFMCCLAVVTNQALTYGVLRYASVPMALWWFYLYVNDIRYNFGHITGRSLCAGLAGLLRRQLLRRPAAQRTERRMIWQFAACLPFFLFCALSVPYLLNHWFAYGIRPILLLLICAAGVGLIALQVWLMKENKQSAAELDDLLGRIEAAGAGRLEGAPPLPQESDFHDAAEQLSHMEAGLRTALDERMRSERMKVELITNVSHDLKTPLTSIINYVDLLRKQGLDSPHAPEYLEVLERKSHRLKKLTEDLVEASKASTGSLPVHLERLGMVQLLQQALGEWEERFVQSGLTAVPTYPAEEAWIMADGRHLWRVIDNLLSNCNKYALEGTRVYIEIFRGKGSVSLSVKNVSRDPLNVPPERLMERFVRGEESRTTEGAGLGLSIAKSLTELQGGTFELVVDGDLFKAIVTLPQSS